MNQELKDTLVEMNIESYLAGQIFAFEVVIRTLQSQVAAIKEQQLHYRNDNE